MTDRHPDAPWGGWQDTMVSTIRSEIDQGRIVRVQLPGALRPVPIEDAGTHGPFVLLEGPGGGRFFIGDMAGVVLLSDPLGPGGTARQSVHPELSVDDDAEAEWVRRLNEGRRGA